MIRATLRLILLVALVGPMAASATTTPGQLCEKSAGASLRTCVKNVGKLEQQCYQTTGSACAQSDAALLEELAGTAANVLSGCPDHASVEAAGFGPVLAPAGLVDRIGNACTGFVASLAARSYGGPHAAARTAASDADRNCLDRAWRHGQSLAETVLRQHGACIRKMSGGRTCDTGRIAAKLAGRQSSTAAKIAGNCPAPLGTLVAVSPAVFAERAAAHARCLVATAYGQTAALDLDCGPRADVPVPVRGVDTQIVLPRAVWGSRCGNGSDYAFRVRLAPEGSPVENVVVHMQGGGACSDGAGCAARSPGLFEAMNDDLPTGGMMSSTAAANPFRDWTKVSLPYCTQDLHIGGGVATVYPQITVQRYGARNVRAAMQYLRDVIWAELDATDPGGYRADRPRMVFSGSSAGGYGAAYNYHWVLDDLGWVHTSAVPDAGLGMGNGTAGVVALGNAVLKATFPGWNTQPYMPPYCFTGDCHEIFVHLEAATAPRLLAVPEQQFLRVSNQIDDTQQTSTGFASTVAFVNTLRSNYCSVQGTPGLHSFLRASSTSIHVQLNNEHWDGAVIAGTSLRDWLGNAMNDPAVVVDRTEEGTLVADFAGVLPFPCTLD